MLRLTNDNVLISFEKEEKLSSLLYSARKKEQNEAGRATVHATGPGYYPDIRLKPDRKSEPVESSPIVSAADLVPNTVRVGDTVLVDSQLVGQPVDPEALGFDSLGRVWRIVRESEILAVLEEDDQ